MLAPANYCFCIKNCFFCLFTACKKVAYCTFKDFMYQVHSYSVVTGGLSTNYSCSNSSLSHSCSLAAVCWDLSMQNTAKRRFCLCSSTARKYVFIFVGLIWQPVSYFMTLIGCFSSSYSSLWQIGQANAGNHFHPSSIWRVSKVQRYVRSVLFLYMRFLVVL